MSRKKERILITVMGIWQIIDGLLTIFVYGFYQLKLGQGTNAMSLVSRESNAFMLICTFGALLIGLGLANLVISKRYVKDNQVCVKLGIYLLIQALFSYFILDIISLVIGMVAGVVMLAKNKRIRIESHKF